MKDAWLGQPLRFQFGHELPGNCSTLLRCLSERIQSWLTKYLKVLKATLLVGTA
jgi:hypothetical protein